MEPCGLWLGDRKGVSGSGAGWREPGWALWALLSPPPRPAWWAAAPLVPAGPGASPSSLLETHKGGAWARVPSVTWHLGADFLLPSGSPFCSSSGLQALPLPGLLACRWIEAGCRAPGPPAHSPQPHFCFHGRFRPEPCLPGVRPLLSSRSPAAERGEQGCPVRRQALCAGSLGRPQWGKPPPPEVCCSSRDSQTAICFWLRMLFTLCSLENGSKIYIS